jgi:hypothetical protein
LCFFTADYRRIEKLAGFLVGAFTAAAIAMISLPVAATKHLHRCDRLLRHFCLEV